MIGRQNLAMEVPKILYFALLFSNVDAVGKPDYNTMHAGLPPTSVEKWGFPQWVREFPKG